MRETKVPCQVYECHMHCDCGGELKSTGELCFTDPVKIKHICDQCGTFVMHTEAYPKYEYVKQENR